MNICPVSCSEKVKDLHTIKDRQDVVSVFKEPSRPKLREMKAHDLFSVLSLLYVDLFFFSPLFFTRYAPSLRNPLKGENEKDKKAVDPLLVMDKWFTFMIWRPHGCYPAESDHSLVSEI